MDEHPPRRRRRQPPGATARLQVMVPPAVLAAVIAEAERRNCTWGLVVADCLGTCLDIEEEARS